MGELHVTTLPGTPGFISIFSRELSKGPEEGVRLTIRRAREEHVLRVVALLGEGMRYGTVRPMDSAVLASTLFDVALPVCSYAGQHRSSAAIRDSM